MPLPALCQAPNCPRPAKKKGYCTGHYQQVARGRPLTPLQEKAKPSSEPKSCAFEGCERLAQKLGYCGGHYQQVKAGRSLHPIREHMRHEGCIFPGCPHPHEAKRYCNGHYQQLRQGRTLAPLLQIHERCTFPDCDRPHEARGYCYGHYGMQKAGLPLRPLLDTPSPTHFDGSSWRVALFGREQGRAGVVVAHARIDEEDLPRIQGMRFNRSWSGYAQVPHGGPLLHRYLLAVAPGCIVRHINGDPLDNRRNNLRVVKAECCAFPACAHTATALGLCAAHRRQQRRNQRLRALRDVPHQPYQNAEGTWCIDLHTLSGVVVGTALFDGEDLQVVQTHRWHMVRKGYCATTGAGRGARFLHRMVLNLGGMAQDAVEVDHINGNKLDNRRMNLRKVSRAENAQNLGVSRNSTTGVRGVIWDRVRQQYRAEMRVAGKRHYAGRFLSLSEADAVVSQLRQDEMSHTNEDRRKR
jgi:hypothetical protein